MRGKGRDRMPRPIAERKHGERARGRASYSFRSPKPLPFLLRHRIARQFQPRLFSVLSHSVGRNSVGEEEREGDRGRGGGEGAEETEKEKSERKLCASHEKPQAATEQSWLPPPSRDGTLIRPIGRLCEGTTPSTGRLFVTSRANRGRIERRATTVRPLSSSSHHSRLLISPGQGKKKGGRESPIYFLSPSPGSPFFPLFLPSSNLLSFPPSLEVKKTLLFPFEKEKNKGVKREKRN